MSKIDSNIGKIYGYFTIIQKKPSTVYINKNGSVYKPNVLAKCKCGKEKIIRLEHLRTSKTISCGCKKKYHSRTHGKSKTRLYGVWEAMIQRTKNKKCRGFKWYGERGIYVCKEWETFINFYKDMGPGPKDRIYTLDRIDNDKGYSPDNCWWATWKQQCENRRKPCL